MKQLLIGVTAIMTAAIGPVWAQVPPLPIQQPQWAPAIPYPLNAPTPDDAYRQGLINRWQFEQLAGPLPPAFQGPSVDGDRGGRDGGSRQ